MSIEKGTHKKNICAIPQTPTSKSVELSIFQLDGPTPITE